MKLCKVGWKFPLNFLPEIRQVQVGFMNVPLFLSYELNQVPVVQQKALQVNPLLLTA